MDFFGSLLNPFVHLFQTGINVLYEFLSGLGFPNYGFAIILLTIIIKMVLYPLTVKQVKSMKAMHELSPKMKKIQEKYKDDPQQQQVAVGKLYKEAGYNPASGCLPMVLQMMVMLFSRLRTL